MVDLFYAHVFGMDVFARGLLIAAKSIDGRLDTMVKERYASWNVGVGKLIFVEKERVSFDELDDIARGNGPIPQVSGRQELLERVFDDECDNI